MHPHPSLSSSKPVALSEQTGPPSASIVPYERFIVPQRRCVCVHHCLLASTFIARTITSIASTRLAKLSQHSGSATTVRVLSRQLPTSQPYSSTDRLMDCRSLISCVWGANFRIRSASTLTHWPCAH